MSSSVCPTSVSSHLNRLVPAPGISTALLSGSAWKLLITTPGGMSSVVSEVHSLSLTARSVSIAWGMKASFAFRFWKSTAYFCRPSVNNASAVMPLVYLLNIVCRKWGSVTKKVSLTYSPRRGMVSILQTPSDSTMAAPSPTWIAATWSSTHATRMSVQW